MTVTAGSAARWVRRLSAIPTPRYSSAGSLLTLSRGRTAITGRGEAGGAVPGVRLRHSHTAARASTHAAAATTLRALDVRTSCRGRERWRSAEAELDDSPAAALPSAVSRSAAEGNRRSG